LKTLVEDRWAVAGELLSSLRDAECFCIDISPSCLRCPFCHQLVSMTKATLRLGVDGRILEDVVLEHESCTIQIVDGVASKVGVG